jgi:putative ABC transport system permease protein
MRQGTGGVSETGSYLRSFVNMRLIVRRSAIRHCFRGDSVYQNDLMFRNYLLTAWRNLVLNRVYSVINIAGLSLGLSCVMLIVLYVKDEVSYDRFLPGVDHIYRVTAGSSDPGFSDRRWFGITGLLQGPEFSAKVPGIRAFVRAGKGEMDIQTKDGVQSVPSLYADSNFFSVLGFPLLSGDAHSALASPAAVVLSEDAALRQFGTTDAVGKVLFIKGDSGFVPHTVTAVAKRVPQNSSIQFQVVTPMTQPKDAAANPFNWYSFFLTTYFVLEPNANIAGIEAGMGKVYRQEAASLIAKSGQKDDTQFGLQPFTSMHLGRGVSQEELTDASNPIYAYILSGIAVFILLIAAINFVNLTVARSIKRAKEIGVRKVLGGDRKQLMMQFLGEAFLLCMAAFVAAILLVQVVLPLFNRLSNKALSFSYLLDARLIAAYVGLFLVTGLLAGFYPALVISGFKPVQALYSRQTVGGRGWLQKGLVIVQFGLASFLIIGTAVMFSQFHYLTTEKLGYDDIGLVLVNKRGLSQQEIRVFRDELMKDVDIAGVVPKDPGGGSFNMGKINGDSGIGFANVAVDENFLPLLKIPLVAGRNFSSQYPSDSTHSVMVNEAFVKKAGWVAPIGETVAVGDKKYMVIGVVKDYHFDGLDKEVNPELLSEGTVNEYGMVYIKLRPGPSAAALRHIEKTFKALFPMSPFAYTFKNDENYAQYAMEAKWKQIILFGAVLTIFISCIGLFGLSVLAAERRTKEIGVRKVLGASVGSVVRMLSTDFLKLVGVALLLAVPVAWYLASKWLEKYPYRIALSGWIFAGAGAVVVGVALMTVSFQALRAGRANPVKSLRVE